LEVEEGQAGAEGAVPVPAAAVEAIGVVVGIRNVDGW
jgi:hypothetical protein